MLEALFVKCQCLYANMRISSGESGGLVGWASGCHSEDKSNPGSGIMTKVIWLYMYIWQIKASS